MSVRTISADVASCAGARYHRPRPHMLHIHHIVPLGWGGPDHPENELVLCPNCHLSAVHILLTRLRKTEGKPGWDFERQFGPRIREIARLGWERYKETLRD